eukprot:m.477141 g.477141  ORF g.477141 m.477141 type:complete len:487 (+) comp20756_c0_seq1:139-1599(+)
MAALRLVGLCAVLAAVVAVAASRSAPVSRRVQRNATHFVTNSYLHTDERAFPLHRPGHNRDSGARKCIDIPACNAVVKHVRMEALKKMKEEKHDECAAASLCPRNRLFQSGAKCVNGKAGQYDCNNVDLQSFVPISAMGSTYDASDSWGWTDPETGNEIAIVAMMDSTSFVDITDPINPVVLGALPQTGSNKVIWGDMKVFANHVFIVRESRNHGMQVFDLTKLRPYYNTPSSYVRELKQDAFYSEVTSSHNIVINEQTGFAYLVGTTTCRGGLHAVDISDPLKPSFAGCFSDDGYTHDAQCVVYNGPDKAYKGQEICFNFNEDTLTIVDVSDKSDMKILSRVTYDLAYYTHQGWVTEDHTYLMANDELDETNGPNKHTRTMLWDVRSLTDPKLVGSHYAENQAIDHNLYIKGDYGYLTNYCDGLRILDATSMASGKAPEVAFFDVADYCDSVDFQGSWSNYPYFKSGNIVVSSIELGLFVLKPTF